MWHPDSVFDGAGHLDEGVVHAWLDGALASGPAAELEAHGEACAPCAARIAEARGFVAGAHRVLGALDHPVAGAAPAWHPPVQRPGRARRIPRWTTRRASLAAAAGLMLAVGSLVVGDQLGRGTGQRRQAVVDTTAPAPQAEVIPDSAARQAAPGSPVPVPARSADAGSPAATTAAPQAPPPPAPASATDVTHDAPGRSNAPDARGRWKTNERLAANAALVPATVLAAAPAADRAADRAAQVSPGDSGRPRLSAPVQLDEIVVTGLAHAPDDDRRAASVAILAGCWRINGTDTVVVFDVGTGRDGRQERYRPRASSEDRAVAGLFVNGRRSAAQWEATVDSAGSLRLVTVGSDPSGAMVVRRERLGRNVCP